MGLILFPSSSTPKSAEKNLDSAVSLLKNIEPSRKKYFLELLQNRKNDFENELSKTNITSFERQMIVDQYSRFAKTVLHCIETPENAPGSIDYYFRQRYYNVGITDTIKPNPVTRSIAIGITGIGVALLIGAIPAFFVNPLVSLIMVAVAISILLPSTFALLIPDSPDTAKKKEEEKLLLQEGAKLVKPELTFRPSFDEENSSSSSDRFSMDFVLN